MKPSSLRNERFSVGKNQLSERSILRTNIPLRNGKINSVKDELSERSTLRNSNIQKWKYQISEIPKNVSFSNGKIKSEKYQFSEKMVCSEMAR